MKKYSYLIIIFICFFINIGITNAFVATSCKGTNEHEYNNILCFYKSADGKYSAESYATLNHCSGNLKIFYKVKVNEPGKEKSKEVTVEGNNANSLEITNECPQFLSFHIKNGWHLKADEDISGGVRLNLYSAENQQISTMGRLQEAHGYYCPKYYYYDEVYQKNKTDEEGQYICKYNNGQEKLEFTASYAKNIYDWNNKTILMPGATISGEHLGGVYGTDSARICPGTVYKIEKSGVIGWRLHGNDFPKICASEGVKCTKYTPDSELTYQDYLEDKATPIQISKSYTYKYKKYDLLLKQYELDESDYLNVNVSAVQKGSKTTFNDLKIKYNGNDIYLFSDNISKMESVISQDIFSGGDLANNLYCFTAKDFKKLFSDNTYAFYLGGISNGHLTEQNPPTDYSNLYCSFQTMVEKDLHQLGQSKIYVRSLSNADVLNLYDRIAALENLVNSGAFDQNEVYEESLSILKQCKKIIADLNNKETTEPYPSCVKFIDDTIPQWAEAGYFGNRIVTGDIGTDCDAVLGSLGVWLTRIYKILLVSVPVIIVAFGFKDFIKALTSGKEDELKKAGSTFIKRLVFGAVFVALPIIIKVILTLALGGDLANICIL